MRNRAQVLPSGVDTDYWRPSSTVGSATRTKVLVYEKTLVSSPWLNHELIGQVMVRQG